MQDPVNPRRKQSLTATAGWTLAVVLGSVVGCASNEPAAEPAAESAPQQPAPSSEQFGQARTLPVPGVPADPSPLVPQLGPSPKATDSNRLVWSVPDTWISEPPGSIRLAQYRVPGKTGDAELVVFYFGPGQGGDPLSNAFRWAGQLEQPDGRRSEDLVELQALAGAQLPTQWMELTGNYTGGMRGDPIPNAMLMAGIVEGPDAPWFFKFVGPEATLRAEREAFLQLLRSTHRPS